MTRTTSALAMLMILAAIGCGPTLAELRATPPVAKTVDKDAACVFARLQRTAQEEQTCDICAQLVWTGNWDPTLGEGIVRAHVTYYEYWPIMFTIRAEGSKTIIEKRVPEHYLSRYGDIANRLYTGTDYSRCPAPGAGTSVASPATGP